MVVARYYRIRRLTRQLNNQNDYCNGSLDRLYQLMLAIVTDKFQLLHTCALTQIDTTRCLISEVVKGVSWLWLYRACSVSMHYSLSRSVPLERNGIESVE